MLEHKLVRADIFIPVARSGPAIWGGIQGIFAEYTNEEKCFLRPKWDLQGKYSPL